MRMRGMESRAQRMSNRYTKLRAHRKRSGLTQKELAFLLGGKQHSTISRYEAGDRRPDLRTALAYGLLFESALRDLFPGVQAEVVNGVGERALRLWQEISGRGEGGKIKYKLKKLGHLKKDESGN